MVESVVLRKLIAIALLAVFGLPLIPSLFAMTPASDADVPACCRGNGAHQCLRKAHMRATPANTPAATAICPYAPGMRNALVVHPEAFVVPTHLRLTKMLGNSTVAPAHEDSRSLASRQRTQQKRGPPFIRS